MSKSLRRCPFCGGRGRVVVSPMSYVTCSVCHANSGFIPMTSDYKEAIRRWNMRYEKKENVTIS